MFKYVFDDESTRTWYERCLMSNIRCDKCGSEMRKTGKMNSGNSVFSEYTCVKCINKKVLCEGVIRV